MSLGYPFPGTEYYDIAQELDLIDKSKHLHNFIYLSRTRCGQIQPGPE